MNLDIQGGQMATSLTKELVILLFMCVVKSFSNVLFSFQPLGADNWQCIFKGPAYILEQFKSGESKHSFSSFSKTYNILYNTLGGGGLENHTKSSKASSSTHSLAFMHAKHASVFLFHNSCQLVKRV